MPANGRRDLIRRLKVNNAQPNVNRPRRNTSLYHNDIEHCNFKLSTCFRVTNTRCRIGTVFSPDNGHIVARNMYRKTINILRKFVHQVGSIYKRLYKVVQI